MFKRLNAFLGYVNSVVVVVLMFLPTVGFNLKSDFFIWVKYISSTQNQFTKGHGRFYNVIQTSMEI